MIGGRRYRTDRRPVAAAARNRCSACSQSLIGLCPRGKDPQRDDHLHLLHLLLHPLHVLLLWGGIGDICRGVRAFFVAACVCARVIVSYVQVYYVKVITYL